MNHHTRTTRRWHPRRPQDDRRARKLARAMKAAR